MDRNRPLLEDTEAFGSFCVPVTLIDLIEYGTLTVYSKTETEKDGVRIPLETVRSFKVASELTGWRVTVTV